MSVSAEDLAAARVALARLRLGRALEWQTLVRELLGGLGAVVPGLGLTAVFALVLLAGGPRNVSDSPVVMAGVVLAMMSALAIVIGGMPIVMGAVFGAALHVVLLPWYVVRGVKALRRARWRRDAEALLDRDGVVPITWTAGVDGRVEVLIELMRAKVGLTYADRALRAPPRAAGDRCAHCGGDCAAVGEGVWRCRHCAREAFAPLPAAVELAAARAALDAVAAGDVLPLSRRELWRVFRERHGDDYRGARRIVAWIGGAYLACALVSELGWRLHVRWLEYVPLSGIVLLALPLFYLLSVAVHAWFQLRFVQFGPGVASYDRALLGEVLTAVALQGRIGRAQLAAHLGISVDHLAGVLARFERLGGAPVLIDRERGELVSLVAVDIGARACPACGGALEPGRGTAIVCAHCGVILRARRGTLALHG